MHPLIGIAGTLLIVFGLILGHRHFRAQRPKGQASPDPPQAAPSAVTEDPVTQITEEDLDRHLMAISLQRIAIRIGAETPRLIRTEPAPPYADLECQDEEDLASLEAAFPLGTVHVTVDHAQRLRQVFYRTGTFWIVLRQTLQDRKGQCAWAFKELEIRNARPIRVRMPLEARRLLLRQGTHVWWMDGTSAYVVLPASFSMGIALRVVRHKPSGNATKGSLPPLDAEESAAEDKIVRWLAAHADALDAAQAREALNLGGWHIQASDANKPPGAPN